MESFLSADTKLQNVLEKRAGEQTLPAGLGGGEGMEGQVRTQVP